MSYASGRPVLNFVVAAGSCVLLALLIGMLRPAPALAAAPPNDAFAAAQPLSGTSASVPGTTVEATTEPGEPQNYTSGNGSVWYSWTAPQDLVLTIDTCGAPYSTVPRLWRGSSLSSLVEVQRRGDNDCTGGNSEVFNVAAGTTYAISVIESNGFYGDTAFTLTLSSTPTPSNDDFAAPQDLGEALNVDVDGTTAGTTQQSGEAEYLPGPGNGGSVWYRWTAPKRMRVWIDNCGAASNSYVTVSTGDSPSSLKGVEENYGFPQTPYCTTDELWGSRSEFEAIKGTTYVIRVYTDLYSEGAFHLRMREIRFDGSLTQSASATKVKKGKAVTYTLDIKNEGTIPMSPEVDLLTSQPDKLAKAVEGTKYLSITTTKGTCSRETFFVEHPGAVCVPGELAPGESLKIVAKVRPSRSLSHWVDLNYSPGADSPVDDDNPANNPGRAHINTKVKRAKRHH